MSPRPIEARPGWVAALRGQAPREVVLWPAPQDIPPSLNDDSAHGPALQRWRDWCASHAGCDVRLGLSCRWTLQWTVEAPWRHGAELARQVACEQAAHYLGQAFEPDAWMWRCWRLPAARANAAGQCPWLVVAVPRTLLADLKAIARAAQVRLRWLGPWWAARLDGGASGTADWQAHDAGWLLQWRAGPSPGLVPDAGTPECTGHLHCRPLDPADDDATANAAVRGAMGAKNVQHPQGPQGTEGLGEGPFPWSSGLPGPDRPWRHVLRAGDALDFTRQAMPMAPWAWALPVLGLLGLLAGTVQWQALDARTEALQAQAQRLQQAEHRLRVQRAVASPTVRVNPASPVPPNFDSSEPWAPDQQAAAQAVMARLGWPWLHGLARSTAGADPAHTRWTQWQADLGALEAPWGPSPVITLSAWTRHDEALSPWLAREPQARWMSRERLTEPLQGQAGTLTVKGQWQMPWPESHR